MFHSAPTTEKKTLYFLEKNQYQHATLYTLVVRVPKHKPKLVCSMLGFLLGLLCYMVLASI
jgi:hypothetical protein